jgi:hypothetical protein
MTVKEIAEKIPESYRAEILELNMINRAQASRMDASMEYLFTTWKIYVEPEADLTLDCGLCVERVLQNWKAIMPSMIELEKNRKLLAGL